MAYEQDGEMSKFAYLSFPLKMIQLLISHKIKPVCVFDGHYMKAKELTARMRKVEKLQSKKKADALKKQGHSQDAKKYEGRALVISPEMVSLLIDILHLLDVELFMAPYEADSQISYLLQQKYCDLAISEDSDLLVFGCPAVLTKLKHTGECKYVDLSPVWKKKQFEDKNLTLLSKLDFERFVEIAIMSGCDYLPSINRMGLKSVIKHYSKHNTFPKVMKFLRESKSFKNKIPLNYEECVKLVKLHFRHQTVFDPYNKTLTSLTPMKRGTSLPLEGKVINHDDLDFYSKGMVNKLTGET